MTEIIIAAIAAVAVGIFVMRFWAGYQASVEFRKIVEDLAEVGIDRESRWLEQQQPHLVLALLKDRAQRVLAQ